MARQGRQDRGREESDLIEKLVGINRVAKVVKGGRRFGFAALVVVGDGQGRVGAGSGKAREVPEAIRKATEQAKRHMIRVPLKERRTLHHDAHGEFGAGRIVLRSAPAGTGIIAGGPARAVFEALGVGDVVAKSTGSSNPYNQVKATLAALASMAKPADVAARRGRRVSEIVGRRADEGGDRAGATESGDGAAGGAAKPQPQDQAQPQPQPQAQAQGGAEAGQQEESANG